MFNFCITHNSAIVDTRSTIIHKGDKYDRYSGVMHDRRGVTSCEQGFAVAVLIADR